MAYLFFCFLKKPTLSNKITGEFAVTMRRVKSP